MDSNVFYGFRGNILFPNQLSLFNYNLKNDSQSKNKIFKDFFAMIKEVQKYESKYQNRVYYLIYKKSYDNILHCQLARKKKFNKRDLIENNIIEVEDDDYPYVNIFIELNSQKFLIESSTQVFENYNTCGKVIENIINSNLKYKDVRIQLNPIIEEENFWNYFNDERKVYNIEFQLVTPNMFDAEDDANTFLKEAEKNVGSSKVTLNFSNPEGNLKPNKTGIDSFIKYISAGGGNWKINTVDKNGKRQYISSKQKSIKVLIPINRDLFKQDSLSVDEISIIKEQLKNIETIKKFKVEK